MTDAALIADISVSRWQRDWHRAQAANLRAQAAAFDRYERSYDWTMNSDEIDRNREVAADLRQKAAEHEEKARAL